MERIDLPGPDLSNDAMLFAARSMAKHVDKMQLSHLEGDNKQASIHANAALRIQEEFVVDIERQELKQ